MQYIFIAPVSAMGMQAILIFLIHESEVEDRAEL